MKRLVIFCSAKGGVGKSYASRAFLDLARRAGRSVAAWDLDGGTGSLALLYPDRNPEIGTGSENVRDPESPGRWVDSMHGPADDVVLDVPGGALGDLLGVVHGGAPSLIAEAKVAGRDLVVVSVIGTKKDATFAPIDSIGLFGPEIHHIALKNGYFAASEGFVVFDGIVNETTRERKYGKASDAVRSVGGEVLYLPKLDPITDALLDIEGLTFAAASEAIGTIGRRYSANARYWLASVEAALAGSWLSPSGEVPAGNGKAGRPRVASSNA
jgi:hypothetical protein